MTQQNSSANGNGVERDAKGRLLPGHTPYRNGGQKPGFTERARKATHDGQDVLDYWLTVMRDPKEETRDRLKASQLAISYVAGLPKETVDATVHAGPAVEAILLALVKAQQRLGNGD